LSFETIASGQVTVMSGVMDRKGNVSKKFISTKYQFRTHDINEFILTKGYNENSKLDTKMGLVYRGLLADQTGIPNPLGRMYKLRSFIGVFKKGAYRQGSFYEDGTSTETTPNFINFQKSK